MEQNKLYRTIAELSAQIAARLEAVDQGTCSLSDMDDLLVDMRELEERIIIIRYKGMERMQYPEPSERALLAKAEKARLAPELPLDTQPIMPEAVKVEEPLPTMESDTTEKKEEEDLAESEGWLNQISLIDSIEEISKEGSVNERMKSKSKKSLAQSLSSKKVDSVLKALNLNEKMGLVKSVFNGDEDRFKSLMTEIDNSQDILEAQALLDSAVSEDQRKMLPVVIKLDSLIQRRFL